MKVPGWVPRALSQLAGGLTDLLLPPACPLCDALLDRPREILCPDCLAEIEVLNPPLCERCGQPTSGAERCVACRAEEPPFQTVRSALVFSGSAQRAVLALKLSGKRELGPYLVGLLAAAPLPGLDLRTQEVLVPVPLHRSRLISRGFNQSALLARRIAGVHGLRVDPYHLVRVKKTPSQSQMAGRAERAENVRDAFAVTRGRPFHGRRVCLVDDVVTTGATLAACARILLSAGAREVNAVTLARTVLD